MHISSHSWLTVLPPFWDLFLGFCFKIYITYVKLCGGWNCCSGSVFDCGQIIDLLVVITEHSELSSAYIVQFFYVKKWFTCHSNNWLFRIQICSRIYQTSCKQICPQSHCADMQLKISLYCTEVPLKMKVSWELRKTSVEGIFRINIFFCYDEMGVDFDSCSALILSARDGFPSGDQG